MLPHHQPDHRQRTRSRSRSSLALGLPRSDPEIGFVAIHARAQAGRAGTHLARVLVRRGVVVLYGRTIRRSPSILCVSRRTLNPIRHTACARERLIETRSNHSSARHTMKIPDSLPLGSHSPIVSRLKRNMNKPSPRIRPPLVCSQGESVVVNSLCTFLID